MKEQRKIFNYESSILADVTLDKEGYFPNSLGRTSTKWVWATCRFCGEVHRIRYGFFNKSGSACHKECKLKEQSLQSPFLKKEVREKSKQTILDRFGVEFASQNKEIANKISTTKLSKESQQKTKNTNLEKYNVENVFQSEMIKEKIRSSLLNKYDIDNPLKSISIQNKVKDTCLKKYGISNLMHFPAFKEKAIDSFSETIKDNESGNYDAINMLRSDIFWKDISEGMSLSEVCFKHNLKYQTIASTLSREEFKDKFQKEYTFPRNQEQYNIKNIIESFGFKCIMNDRSIISPLELDLYIPEKKFAIEYNGSFWHSEAVLDVKDAKNKHCKKTRLCKEKGVRLFHIFEHDWINNKSQTINFIKTILGINSIKIGARKCDLVEKESCIKSKEFINRNHMQGYGFGTIKFFNLTYNDLIIASMTASKHHRQNVVGNPIVLNRLCFEDGYNIQGGSTKLFSAFISWAKNNGYDRILSWSDNKWTEGNIYKILGFINKKEYDPDYFYYDSKNKKYCSKQSQMKSINGCPKETTEREFCFSNGLFRIWDCGKTLWEYDLV